MNKSQKELLKEAFKRGTVKESGVHMRETSFIEESAPSASTNTGSLKFFCCLGKSHPCQLNVNDGFCAAESCQYRVAEKLQAGA